MGPFLFLFGLIIEFADESLKVRQQNAETMNEIENRVIKAEGRLDGHDIELKHLYEKEAKRNEKN
ncbi:protein of unknown function [Lactiplantibacillus plantarum]|uniref:hypothetical protein n=1 Tax=Lactiplantibacillus plantarum TaxID=1590 RepID=UPI0021A9BF88|nr:hypothetical protein [Lactiplantibacillus plantarum]MCT4441619.1 hypothetical protein [Lactiplantibacillus plantarum]